MDNEINIENILYMLAYTDHLAQIEINTIELIEIKEQILELHLKDLSRKEITIDEQGEVNDYIERLIHLIWIVQQRIQFRAIILAEIAQILEEHGF